MAPIEWRRPATRRPRRSSSRRPARPVSVLEGVLENVDHIIHARWLLRVIGTGVVVAETGIVDEAGVHGRPQGMEGSCAERAS